MLKLAHGRVVTPFRTLEDTCIWCQGETIVRVGPDDGGQACRELDLTGLYVTPGFLDVHVHGGGGCEFWTEDPEEILPASTTGGRWRWTVPPGRDWRP